MGENKGFGKGSRNEGYKPAGWGGKGVGARGQNSGGARGSSTSNSGGARGSASNFRSKPKDAQDRGGSADFRSGKPKDAQDKGGSADFRSSKSKDSQNKGGSTDFRGGRSKTGTNGFKSGHGTEKPQGFVSDAFHGDKKSSEYKRNDRQQKQPDYRSKRDELQESRNVYEENKLQDTRNDFEGNRAEEFQGDLDKLEGRNSVLEALKSGRSINRIFVAKGDREGSVNQIIAMARQHHILVQEIDRAKLDAMSVTQAHQGVIALTAAKDYVEVDDILEIAAASGRAPFIIILDEITDSHNLGSILRTANAAGVHGVIIPKRRAVGLTSVVSKASAGAIEYVPVARVTNIVQTIEKLKKQNIWVAGTDATGEKPYFEMDLTGPIALVIGSEGEGMGKLVRESCDFVVNIPMLGQISSLNAAVAGAIVTYEILRQRSKK